MHELGQVQVHVVDRKVHHQVAVEVLEDQLEQTSVEVHEVQVQGCVAIELGGVQSSRSRIALTSFQKVVEHVVDLDDVDEGTPSSPKLVVVEVEEEGEQQEPLEAVEVEVVSAALEVH